MDVVLPGLPYFRVAPHFEQEEAEPLGKWAVEVWILVLLLSWEPTSCFVRLETGLQEKNRQRDRQGRQRQGERVKGNEKICTKGYKGYSFDTQL